MNSAIKEQILFVLDDDNEVMSSALDSDMDEKNKQMNRELIAEHGRLAGKVERGDGLTRHELKIVWDANEIHVNDVENLAGRHRQAILLDEWLQAQDCMTKE